MWEIILCIGFLVRAGTVVVPLECIGALRSFAQDLKFHTEWNASLARYVFVVVFWVGVGFFFFIFCLF